MQYITVALLLALGCLASFATADVILVGDATTEAVWSVSLDGSVQTQVVASIDAATVVVSSALNVGFAAALDVSGNIKGLVAFNADGSGQIQITIPANYTFSGALSVHSDKLYFHDAVENVFVEVDVSVSVSNPTFRVVGSIGGGLLVGTVTASSATATDIYINTQLFVYKMKISDGTVTTALSLTGIIPGVNLVLTNGHFYLGIGGSVVQFDLDGTGQTSLNAVFSGTVTFVGASTIDANSLLVIDSSKNVYTVDISTSGKVTVVDNSGADTSSVKNPKSSSTVQASSSNGSSPASRPASALLSLFA